MRAYVEQTWGWWDDAWQRARFEETFTPERTQVIVVDGQDAGVLITRATAVGTEVGLIEIAPDVQGRGIGTAVLRDVLAQAAKEGLPVTLQVLKVNPTRRLYQRLGFSVAGETEAHFRMSCTSPSLAPYGENEGAGE